MHRRLFEKLNLCHADDSFHKRLAAVAKVSALIIDDFATLPIGARERTDLLELLDDRFTACATLITSQLAIENWHDYIGDSTLADAILDRLVHTAQKSTWKAKQCENPLPPSDKIQAQNLRKLTDRDRTV